MYKGGTGRKVDWNFLPPPLMSPVATARPLAYYYLPAPKFRLHPTTVVRGPSLEDYVNAVIITFSNQGK